MPYLQITCSELALEQKSRIAQALTNAVNDLFLNPRSPTTREELRERTTIHFTTYNEGDLYIGGRAPTQRGNPDITVELSDWNMSARQQGKVARKLTLIIADLFAIPGTAVENINIRFHPYPPKDFAVGGRLLSDVIAGIARAAKRFLG